MVLTIWSQLEKYAHIQHQQFKIWRNWDIHEDNKMGTDLRERTSLQVKVRQEKERVHQEHAKDETKSFKKCTGSKN